MCTCFQFGFHEKKKKDYIKNEIYNLQEDLGPCMNIKIQNRRKRFLIWHHKPTNRLRVMKHFFQRIILRSKVISKEERVGRNQRRE